MPHFVYRCLHLWQVVMRWKSLCSMPVTRISLILSFSEKSRRFAMASSSRICRKVRRHISHWAVSSKAPRSLDTANQHHTSLKSFWTTFKHVWVVVWVVFWALFSHMWVHLRWRHSHLPLKLSCSFLFYRSRNWKDDKSSPFITNVTLFLCAIIATFTAKTTSECALDCKNWVLASPSNYNTSRKVPSIRSLENLNGFASQRRSRDQKRSFSFESK